MDSRFSDPKAEHLWANARVGLAWVGPDGGFLRVNEFFAGLLGYSQTELESRDYQSITHPDDVGADEEAARAVADGRLPSYTMAKRYLRRGPEPVVWVRLHVTRHQVNDEEWVFLAQVAPIKPAQIAEQVKPPATTDDLARFLRKNWQVMAAVASVLGLAALKACSLW